MALGDSYVSVLDLETRLGKPDDGTFADLLDAASRTVEDFCRRQFNKATAASARRYRAVDPTRLPVDDFYVLTDLAVEVDGTAWVVATDVELRPPDGIRRGQQGWPYSDLLAIIRPWPSGRRALVEITARWGWNTVPEGVKQATLDVAAVMSYGGGGSSGVVSSESIDGYSVSYSSPALGAEEAVPAELVKAKPYRRPRFGVG